MTKEVIELFQPCNGDHGLSFMSRFCFRCAKFPPDSDAKKQCGIFLRSQAFDTEDKEYPKQWRYVDGEPTCTAFKNREDFNARRREKRKSKIPVRVIDENNMDLF